MWLDSSVCYSESKKVNRAFCELEFVRVEYAAGFCTLPYELTGSEEVVPNVVVVECRVINTAFSVLSIFSDEIHPMCVSIPTTDKSLGCRAVLVSSPWSQESGEVAVSWMDRHRVISMPVV